MKQLFLLLLSTFFINAYAIEIYTCQDENGNIQYTQIPSDVCREKLELKMTPPVTTHVVTEGEEAERVEEPKKTTQSAAERLKENCIIARQNLVTLNSENQVTKPDPKNPEQFIILTDEMRQQEITELQAYINKKCLISEEE